MRESYLAAVSRRSGSIVRRAYLLAALVPVLTVAAHATDPLPTDYSGAFSGVPTTIGTIISTNGGTLVTAALIIGGFAWMFRKTRALMGR